MTFLLNELPSEGIPPGSLARALPSRNSSLNSCKVTHTFEGLALFFRHSIFSPTTVALTFRLLPSQLAATLYLMLHFKTLFSWLFSGTIFCHFVSLVRCHFASFSWHPGYVFRPSSEPPHLWLFYYWTLSLVGHVSPSLYVHPQFPHSPHSLSQFVWRFMRGLSPVWWDDSYRSFVHGDHKLLDDDVDGAYVCLFKVSLLSGVFAFISEWGTPIIGDFRTVRTQ